MTITKSNNNNNNNNSNSNKQDDLPFKYYLEKMKNIKSIHLVIIPLLKNVVYYYDVKMTSVRQYSIDIIDKSNELIRYNLKIKLPIHSKIEPRSTIISKEPLSTSLLDNSIEIKSKLLIDESNFDQHLFQDNVLDDNHSSSIDSINSISSLFNNNNNNNNNNSTTSPQLYCRCCLNSIIKPSNIDTIWKTKVLPSSNWIELMDVWLCGCTGTTSFTDFPTGEINSMLNYCFIGDRYLLFHKDNIKELSILDREQSDTTTGTANIIYDEMNKQSTSWVPLKCDYCKSFIGSVDNSTSNNFRLFKHQISTSIINSNDNNLFKQYQLETFIASQILTESQSSVTFKFLLTSLDDNKIYAMISLLNWETLLLTNYYGNDNDDNFIPIVKILFKATTFIKDSGDTMENQKKEIQELLNKWEFDFEAKRIYLPSEECFQLIEIMNYSNSMFPINANKIKSHSNFNIGILRLRLLLQQRQ